MEAAGAFGIAFRLSAGTGASYCENNIDVSEAPAGRGVNGLKRATFRSRPVA